MKDRRYVISVILITLVILAVGWGFRLSGSVNHGTLPDSSWTLGTEDAPVTIDMFPDFLCSICLEKERYAVKAFHDYSGTIRLVYHHYPEQPDSGTIAEALEAAGEQGKFWEMHDALTGDGTVDIAVLTAAAMKTDTSIPQFIRAGLDNYAGAIGLDTVLFDRVIDSGSFQEKVRMEKETAEAAGVKTAGIYVNGQEYQKGHGTLQDLYAVIDDELERLGYE